MHKRNRTLIVSALAGLFILFSLIIAFSQVNRLAEESGFQELQMAADQLAADIRSQVEKDRERLTLAAEVLGELEEFPSKKAEILMRSCEEANEEMWMELLLPDDTVAYSDGRRIPARGIRSFEAEAERGFHMSDGETDVENPERRVLRNCVPVRKNGETVAVLSGVVDIHAVPGHYQVNIFGGEAEMYLVNGKNGNFLMDTWHETLGNLYDFRREKMKPGYDSARMCQEVMNGISGNAAFWSEGAKDYFYMHYEPVGINDWVAMLSVEGEVVFQKTFQIRNVLMILMGVDAAVLLAYFGWVLYQTELLSRDRGRKLTVIRYLAAVEELLLEVHRKPRHLERALRVLSEAVEADAACFLMAERGKTPRMACYHENPMPDQDGGELCTPRQLLEVFSFLKEGECQAVTDAGKFAGGKEPMESFFQKAAVKGFVAIRILALEETEGILVVFNPKNEELAREMVSGVALGFAMALNNMETHAKLSRIGRRDQLTGLLNRNSFQETLERYKKKPSEGLFCLFGDVDGLHDINNHLGHVAGDAMLKATGEKIREIFGDSNAYRIGGDEFVAFGNLSGGYDVERQKNLLEKAVEASAYHISLGAALLSETGQAEEMVKAAESRMNEAKRQYYAERKEEGRIRQMNVKLDAILEEKRASDKFLSLLSGSFLGVYMVNMKRDQARSIYIPPYFKEMLGAANGSFTAAMGLYMEQAAAPGSREVFRPLLDLNRLGERLLAEGSVEVSYERTDQSQVLLSIFPAGENMEGEMESIWIFKKQQP